MIPFSIADMLLLLGVVLAIWACSIIIELREERRHFRDYYDKIRRENDKP